MTKTILRAGLAMGLLMLGLANTASAYFYFHYDASVTPDHPSLADVFSTQVFPSTSWSASGGELTMTTAYLQDIWFGNTPHWDPVPWQVGSSSQGNMLSTRAKLLPGSEDWHAYIYDGDYTAWVRIFPGEVRMTYEGGESTFALDTLAFHTYSFTLVNGLVTYAVDGSKVFSENAAPLVWEPVLVIGDGSGISNSGTGSFVIDDVIIIAGQAPIPSAGILVGAGLASLAGMRLRRKKQ